MYQSAMANFFTIPDKERNYQSYMVFVLSIMWWVVMMLIVAIGFIYFPHLSMRWSLLIGIALFIAMVNLTLNRLGYTKIAGWTLTVMLWLFLTIPCYTAGGMMAPGILSQISVILTAGFLLGRSGGFVIGLLTIGTDFWFAYQEIQGNLPIPTVVHNPITRWVSAIIPFGTILALQYYATDHLHTGLKALQREIEKREIAEKMIGQTVYNLKERVKELKTLYAISSMLQNEDVPLKTLFHKITEILPAGWQYPEITAARISFAGTEYTSPNYTASKHYQRTNVTTANGAKLMVEIVYLDSTAQLDEGPFLTEERNLIDMVTEMIRINLEQRHGRAELKDYRYALDLGYMVSITDAGGHFSYVNNNFCKSTQYRSEELLGENFGKIFSGNESREFSKALKNALEKGESFEGEFCNRAKDGTLLWVDTTIVPFLDSDGKVYQHLSISHDITPRKEADDIIRQNEQLLKKITSQIPGNTYLFEIEENGNTKILFMSRGTDSNPGLGFEAQREDQNSVRELVYHDDKLKFNEAMKRSSKSGAPMSIQYRTMVGNDIRWRWLQAVPEKDSSGKTLWYGSSTDITPLVEYIASTEQIIFDISHVIRRPVASLLGLTQLVIDNDLDGDEIKKVAADMHLTADQMDVFIHKLNEVYQQKRQSTKLHIDISALIDKRGSLFQ